MHAVNIVRYECLLFVYARYLFGEPQSMTELRKNLRGKEKNVMYIL